MNTGNIRVMYLAVSWIVRSVLVVAAATTAILWRGTVREVCEYAPSGATRLSQ